MYTKSISGRKKCILNKGVTLQTTEVHQHLQLQIKKLTASEQSVMLQLSRLNISRQMNYGTPTADPRVQTDPRYPRVQNQPLPLYCKLTMAIESIKETIAGYNASRTERSDQID